MTPLRENIVPVSLVTLSMIGITFALYFMKGVLVPFVFSIFLYFIVSPLIRWFMVQCRMPRFLALTITFTLISGIFVGLTLLLGMFITSIIRSSRLYYDNLFKFVDYIATSPLFTRLQIQVDFTIIKQFLQSLPILDWISYISGGVLGVISNTFLILIFLLFIAMGEKSPMVRKIVDDEVESKITRYISTKFFTSFLTGSISFIILLLFNVEVALLLAILTFFLNFIPNVGSVFVVVATIPVLLLKFGLSFPFAIALILLIAVQFNIGNILETKLMGENLGLNPVWVLLSLLFWGSIWGLAGMFLSVPMSAIIKILIHRSEIAHIFLPSVDARD